MAIDVAPLYHLFLCFMLGAVVYAGFVIAITLWLVSDKKNSAPTSKALESDWQPFPVSDADGPAVDRRFNQCDNAE